MTLPDTHGNENLMLNYRRRMLIANGERPLRRRQTGFVEQTVSSGYVVVNNCSEQN